MELPNISDYLDCQSYFSDFYENSKKVDETVSFRTLGKQLDWPHSYISDLIHGRKTLTITRALEFAAFAKFSVIDTERLIYMALRSTGDGDVRSYFNERLKFDLNTDSASDMAKRHAGYVDESDTCIEELKGDIAASALMKFLGANPGVKKIQDIGKLFFSFPELSDAKILKNKLDKLEKNGNIKIHHFNEETFEVEVLRFTIFFEIDKNNLPVFTNYFENMIRIVNSPKAYGNFNFGYANILQSDLKNVMEKMSMLRNYILELDKNACSINNVEDSIMFQYDFNIAPIVDIKELGIKSLKDWGSLRNG